MDPPKKLAAPPSPYTFYLYLATTVIVVVTLVPITKSSLSIVLILIGFYVVFGQTDMAVVWNCGWSIVNLYIDNIIIDGITAAAAPTVIGGIAENNGVPVGSVT